MTHTTIGDRIKRYEIVSKTSLLPNSYVVLRVDGRAFHTWTRGLKKPFDYVLMGAMVVTGESVAKEMSGFKLGYHQSDEFSFVITDTDSYETELWFGGEVQKLCSITASLFTAYFNYEMGIEIGDKPAVFDCRAFNVPKDDVANVFIWRQQDWERNSLQMLARSEFSQSELHGKKCADIHEMLHRNDMNWCDLPDDAKNGTFITKDGRKIRSKLTYDEINNLLGIRTVI